jgi:serine/threonine protein kinase
MSKLSLDKFLALLERSKLLPPERLAEVTSQWKRRATLAELDDAQYLADYLAESQVLTSWQAKKLLEGRHRGFFLGKYMLLDHLGSGGMSSVYLARHVLMQRLVAVKVLPQARVGDASYLARFHLEGQCTAALDHRNIVRAYDLDNDDKIHYLVMEYVEGQDLQALVARQGPLDFHIAADYVAQAAAGLEHAHDAGLVHRDIKPANLLVDRQGTVKILDMGLAKFSAAKEVGVDLSREEQVLGTADYVAPEQTVDSSRVDQRADLYSLGCTLYFLLTGHAPFPTGSPLERITAHQRQIPASLLIERPDTPEPLVELCRRMMEKSPLNRSQSAAEVHRALRSWLASEAAAGQIRQRPVAAAVGGGSAGCGDGGRRSEINPTGSSGAGLSGTSSLTETDSNLHRATERISPAVVAASGEPSTGGSASQSHVFGTDLARFGSGSSPGNTPPPPPLVAPPPCVPLAAVRPAALTGASAPARAPIVGISTTSSGAMRSLPRRSSRAHTARWIGTLLLSLLILGAILLAIFAAGR